MSNTDPSFRGVIGRTYRESTPDWPKPIRAPDGAPNVVFVVLDDVGFAQLGCYGSDISTPNIDKLAAGGLRYTNFHTTAMCSPTRACLLTGRNHHSVGMGIIAEWQTGFPAYAGRLSRNSATLAEMLRPHGYNTFAVGKWHLMPMEDSTAAGPFDYWPQQRGFDRWYGFHGALADSWHPELFDGNQPIDPPDRLGYHLTDDLIDHSIQYIRDQQSAAPGKPFFLYLGLGAVHWPHHVAAEYIERYRGRYDVGWDAVREDWFARQKSLGVVPPDTTLAPRNPGVQPWAELSADEQRVFARQMEVFAGFLEHTDEQVGRLIRFLEQVALLDNTLVVLLSDNGASPEGGASGAFNGRKHLTYAPETLDESLAGLDKLGSELAFNHYPMGWAQAGNTPLKWYKKDTHAGGVRDPLIVHWPAGLADSGAMRHQFHHVVDIVPTVLETLRIEAPTQYAGVPQLPIHGISMAYSFDDASAPSRKQTQYFELLGDRGLWHRGWKAVARHEKGAHFEADRWELYHLDADFSECHDLADQQPEKLREMVERWWVEAGRYGALPLDDREYERIAESIGQRARQTYIYYPGMARIDRFSTPNIADRSHSITAEVEIADGNTEGVLLAAGTRFGGYALYVKNGLLVYEYLYDENTRFTITSAVPLPSSARELRYEFTRTGRGAGRGALFLDGGQVGAAEIPRTWPMAGVQGGITCGRDTGSPVGSGYTPPFTFTGKIRRVVVELGDGGAVDTTVDHRAALSDQ